MFKNKRIKELEAEVTALRESIEKHNRLDVARKALLGLRGSISADALKTSIMFKADAEASHGNVADVSYDRTFVTVRKHDGAEFMYPVKDVFRIKTTIDQEATALRRGVSEPKLDGYRIDGGGGCCCSDYCD